MLSVTDTSPSDWRYVSEGGATIVFSYAGPPNPNFDGTVLRLRKALVPVLKVQRERIAGASNLTGAAPFAESQTDVTAAEEEHDDPTIEYQAKCMERLIPTAHLPRLESVRLNEPWLKNLAELKDVNRPDNRREIDGIDLDRQKGVLATDLVGGNWLAVEIKPKWAFLPSPTHLAGGTASVKNQTCRFCMHNHLRVSKGDGLPVRYCPLDLFSADEARIRRALSALWDAWSESGGTINNLKIFSNGHLVRPAEEASMLAPEIDSTQITEDQIKAAFTNALVPSLVQTPVLGILSKLQRRLDALDIEGLSRLWRQTEASAPLYPTTFSPFFANNNGDVGSKNDTQECARPEAPLGVSSLFLSSPEPNIPDWVEFLDTYLSGYSDELDHANPTPKDLRYYLLAYLLSATFKDCSIIVRLDFLRPGCEAEPDCVPQAADPSRNGVTVIDLDPKSMDKLRKWLKLDNEIAAAYAKKENKKVCVDAHRKL